MGQDAITVEAALTHHRPDSVNGFERLALRRA
jgi:hypothetical protein